MFLKKFFAVMTYLALLASSTLAGAAEKPAHLIHNGKVKINGLSWTSQDMNVESMHSGDATQFYVLIEGVFSRKEEGWILSSGSQDIAVTTASNLSKSFSFKALVKGPKNVIEVTAVSPRGQIEHEEAIVEIPSWDEITQQSLVQESATSGFRVGLDFASISYKDSRQPDNTEFAAGVEASYRHLLFNSKWDWELKGAYTALPISETSNYSIRFLNLAAEIGRIFHSEGSPWSLEIRAGYLFSTMTASTDNVGYSSLSAPELYPILTYGLDNGDSISAMIRYSPLFGSGGLLFLPCSSSMASLSYSRNLSGKHVGTVTLSYSSIYVYVSNVTMVATTPALAVSYSF